VRIGIVARRTGLKPAAILGFEKKGLLSPPARTLSGHRNYGEADVERVWFIIRHSAAGLDVAELLRLISARDGTIGGSPQSSNKR